MTGEGEFKSLADALVIRLAAVLLIFHGTAALVNMVTGVIEGSFAHLDLTILMILVGRGLLNHEPLWRKVARGLAWAGVVLPLIVLLILFFQRDPAPMQLHGVETNIIPSMFWISVLYSGMSFFCFGVQHVLGRKDVVAAFNASIRKKNNWWIVLCIVALLFNAAIAYERFVYKKTLLDIYQAEVSLEIVDDHTGEAITHFSTSRDISTSRDMESVLPRSTMGYSRSVCDVSWVGIRPFEITFSSDGYEEQVVILDSEDNGSIIPVRMTKLKTNDSSEE